MPKLTDSTVADRAIAHSASLANEYPAVMSAADLGATIRAHIACELLRAERMAAIIEAAEWIGESAGVDEAGIGRS